MLLRDSLFYFFFFNDTATTEIYTLSLHDALPILSLIKLQEDANDEARFRRGGSLSGANHCPAHYSGQGPRRRCSARDRKSTRLNSSHLVISYAVFCLKKKKIELK